jgi:uncharacterized protein YndB with AHSA1/START domain
MASKNTPAERKSEPKPKITLMWTYRGSIEEVWDLWTTKEGLESWWGPEEFFTRVRRLDLRPGGDFEYATTATDLSQVEALNAAGRPITRIGRITFLEVVPQKRLVYRTSIDYIPDVPPYDVTALIEFSTVEPGVRMVATQDAMHNSEWTQKSAIDMDRQFNRLAKVIEGRRQAEQENLMSTPSGQNPDGVPSREKERL